MGAFAQLSDRGYSASSILKCKKSKLLGLGASAGAFGGLSDPDCYAKRASTATNTTVAAAATPSWAPSLGS